MHARLRRPAVALITTTLAAGALGFAPAAHAEGAMTTVTGKVTGSGAGVEDVQVSLYTYDVEDRFWRFADYDFTDGSGDYTIAAPEGQYRITFADHSGRFADEAYDNARYVYSADATTVSATSATPVVANADLAVAAHITGTVTGSGDAGALGGIRVVAYEEIVEDGGSYYDSVASETTDEDGSYDLSGLAAGAYRIKFEDDAEGERTWAKEYYDDAPSLEGSTTEDVTVTSGGVVENINAQLALDSEITGIVTGAGDDSNAPVADAEVDVLTKVGTRWEYVAYTETNSAGEYRVDGLPAGTYRVEFGGEVLGGYTREFWKNVRLLGNATNVPVSANVTVGQIDAQLVVGEHNSETGAQFVATAEPTISGAPVVGQTLTSTKGSWTTTDSSGVQPTDFQYAWFRGDNYIEGVFGPTYVPTASDIGLPITVWVYADYDRSGYDTGAAGSAPTTAVSATGGVTTPPVVTPPVVTPPVVTPPVVDVPAGLAAVLKGVDTSGKPQVGKTIKVTGLDAMFRASTAVSYTFKWYAGEKAIKKATKSKLKITRAMKGKVLSVKVTAKASSTSRSVKLKVGKVK